MGCWDASRVTSRTGALWAYHGPIWASWAYMGSMGPYGPIWATWAHHVGLLYGQWAHRAHNGPRAIRVNGLIGLIWSPRVALVIFSLVLYLVVLLNALWKWTPLLSFLRYPPSLATHEGHCCDLGLCGVMYSNRNNHYHHGNRNNLNDPPPSLFPLMDTIMAINVVMVIAMIIIMTGRSIGIIVVTMISMIAIRPFFLMAFCIAFPDFVFASRMIEHVTMIRMIAISLLF